MREGPIMRASGYSFHNGGRVIAAFSPYICGEDMDRLERYRKNWTWYKGRHWEDRERPKSNEDPLVTLNYIKRIANIQSMFLSKNGFDITIPDDPDTDENESIDRSFVKHLLDKTWRYNKKLSLIARMALVGSITGDIFVRVSWREKSLMQPAHARLELLPSQYVFPEFTGEVMDQTMQRCTVMWPVIELEPVQSASMLTRRTSRPREAIHVMREVWTNDEVIRFRDDKEISRGPNPFKMIPIVHIPNIPTGTEFYGAADIDDVIEVNRELNEKSTDLSDVINYHGSPTTVIEGAKGTKLKRGADQIWWLPTGTAKNLELKGDLAASHKYFESIKAALHDVSGVPPIAFGGSPAKPGTSGAALALEFLPMTDVRALKEGVYGSGIQLINALILRAMELKQPSSEFARKFKALPEDNRYMTEIAWPPALPRDESIQLDNDEKRLRLGLASRRHILLERGHGEKTIEQRLAEVDAEREAQAVAELATSKLPGEDRLPASGNPNPTRPNPDSQGQSKSITAETGVSGLNEGLK